MENEKENTVAAHRPRKMFGQNFLTDLKLREFIVNSAFIVKTDTVLEIGPGRGELTGIIALRCPVIAVEIDRDLVKLLRSRFAENSRVEIIEGDILDYDLSKLPPQKLKVIGNVPYYITTPIIFKLLENKEKVEMAVLTIQKEVAERLTAVPGSKEYGVLTVMVGMYAEVKILKKIPAAAFYPAPKVDSAVISIKPLEFTKAAVKNSVVFEKLVKTAFQQRRKNIKNALVRFGAGKEEALEILKTSGIKENARPEDVSIEEFAKIADALS
ncbi:MAG: 16S rRNA (adenine(1518)-N(6)/adenine(1519)-N(6))-dimethyltransferase RsmA [Candidatus Firestonebacteria bacterium]